MSEQVSRVSAHVVIFESGHVLLCRLSNQSDDPGSWTLPGGGLAFGESPEDAARRELIEETGLQVEITGLVGVTSRTLAPNDHRGALHWIRILYTGQVSGGNLTAEIDGSTDLPKWFSLEDAHSLPLVELAKQGLTMAFPEK